jgi:hypothetical protein
MVLENMFCWVCSFANMLCVHSHQDDNNFCCFFVAKFFRLWIHFLQHANHNDIVLKFGHFAGLQVQGKTTCPICWLQLKYRYSHHLHKTVYVEFRQFLSLGHPFRDELKHFFKGVAELDEPSFRCGVAD